MKGIVFNIQKYSVQDGPGIRTIVFLKGCPLRCKWCSNPESGEFCPQIIFQRKLCLDCRSCIVSCPVKAVADDRGYGKVIHKELCLNCGSCVENCPSGALKRIGREMTVEEVISEVEKDSIFYRKTGGGVTLSGGEPFAQAEFVEELLGQLKENRIRTAVETSGYVSRQVLERCKDKVDLFLYDIKHMDEKVHKAYTGVSNRRILDNLKYLNSCGKKIWIRIPLIPRINMEWDNIRRTFKLAEGFACVERVELLPYHRYGVGKYEQLSMDYELKHIKAPMEEELKSLLKMIGEHFPQVKCIIRYH